MDLRGKMYQARKKEAKVQGKENVKEMLNMFEESISVEYLNGEFLVKAYLFNAKPYKFKSEDSPSENTCLLLYFLDESGKIFKGLYQYEPYFFIRCKQEVAKDMMPFIHKTFADTVSSVDFEKKKIDLSQPGHLSGQTQFFLKLKFRNVQDLVNTRNILRPIVENNRKREEREGGYYQEGNRHALESNENMMNYITEIREDDVLYHIRVMIDNSIRCAFWYDVKVSGCYVTSLNRIESKLEKGDLRIMAFDIETTKPPLKFPDSKIDSIMMISYMYEGQGYLAVNRSILSADIQDFTYTPKAEYEGPFIVFNEPDEKSVLERFFSHIRELKPIIISSFNGDAFDWPFIDERSKTYGLGLEKEIGVSCEKGEYMGRFMLHMDCYYWVDRDAYLPQGSHGLKAVTKAKLGYDPVELDPEDILPYAKARPNELAVYSASDAVATFYLYKKLIHDFIFALSTIIPTFPDEVLRLGSGTLCESLLMAEAFSNNIIFPNKHKDNFEKFYEGHLLDTETYIGGHVEALKNGVYRSDIPLKFKIDQATVQDLIEKIDDTLKFAIEIEHKKKVEMCSNYTTVRGEVIKQLKEILELSKLPSYECCPKIYHVDVAAMYPNIILTNRLQPVAIVNDRICASCIYNDQVNNCKRPMGWTWKGDYFPLNRGEYESVKRNIETEVFKTKFGEKEFANLSAEERNTYLKQRVKKYCEKTYKRMHISTTEERKDTVCMREHPFYVNTVLAFRDRRYDYKNKVKQWKSRVDEANKQKDHAKMEECENIMNMYESLQLAHKIILNSFYGYVMRRGARWYSMQMAGIVTYLGGNIITFNRKFLESIGIPLELDTDGIWCLFPQVFPETYTLIYNDGKKANFSFPCAVLNMNTYTAFCNTQYQTLSEDKREYITRTEMSISFEIDGPYRCIVLPAAREEGKMLKKKYAVFNMKGQLQELKGFEMKRRGELNIVKIFQSEVFHKFLEGKTLEDCYGACAEVVERWYDILDSEGAVLSDAELIEYIGEERRLSKSVAGYGTQKSTALTCAKRLAEFLGIDIVKDKGGLNTKFIIAKKPIGKPIAERAIPTSIFTAETNTCLKFLRAWLKDENLQTADMKAIIDWEYYKDRFAKTVQKIITIPAVLQGLANPYPKIAHPDWLKKKLKDSQEGQRTLDIFLCKNVNEKNVKPITQEVDIEDLNINPKPQKMDIEEVKTQVVLSSSEKAAMAEEQEIEQLQNKAKELVKICPSPVTNFDTWLQNQQDIWRISRKLGGDSVRGPKKGLITYLKMQEEMVGKSLWHILEISEMANTPGYLKVWFIAEHEDKSKSKVFNLFTLNLHMRRTFYINSRSPQPENKQVKKILPRGKPVYNLYEMESEEDLFMETSANFDDYLSSPEIEGIYETSIPLSVKAILMLGSIIRPKRAKITLNQSHITQTFNINDFETKHLWNVTYLPPNSFDKVLITHSSKQLRQVWGMFLYATKQAYLFCLHETIKQVEKPNLTRFVMQLLEKNEQYASWKIDTIYTDKFEEVVNTIEANLQEYRAKVHQPVILILQSPKNTEDLIKQGFTSFANDFPIIRAPMNDEDQNYPPLNWQIFAAQNIGKRFLEMEEWLAERVNFSKTAGLPVCNIESDAFKYLIDMLFAKKLYLTNYVLWYSNTGMPDLGGQTLHDSSLAYEDEIENHEIVHPGIYRGYCVELSLSSLAINTILKCDILNSFEGSTFRPMAISDKESGQNERYDPHDIFVTCMDSFAKLKAMVTSWMAEIQKGNIYADRLMQHIYRWLSSPSSKMYDPALHRMIHVIMIKIFLRLIQRFKEHGSVIVYGSFHKLILYTGKSTLEETQNYVEFITKTINTSDGGLYQLILMEPTNYWKILAFKDIYNFGGIQESQPKRFTSSWNIGEYLPPAVEDRFLAILAEYVFKIYNFMQTHNDEDLEDNALEPKEMTDAIDNLGVRDKVIEYMKKLVSVYFTQKLFNLIPDLTRQREEEIDESDSDDNFVELSADFGNKVTQSKKKQRKKKAQERWEFPQNLASHTSMTNPALEFIKFTAEVFGLEPELMDEVIVLKRNLLKMLKIGEYSIEAKYVNPSLIFILQDIICDFCLSIRDIDICRDTAAAKGNWQCIFCNHSYNKEYIENKLIQIVERRVLAYQMQDLRCDKCKMVKNNLLGMYCDCTGRYNPALAKMIGDNTNLLNYNSDIRMFVLLMKRISARNHMDLLSGIVDSLNEIYI